MIAEGLCLTAEHETTRRMGPGGSPGRPEEGRQFVTLERATASMDNMVNSLFTGLAEASTRHRTIALQARTAGLSMMSMRQKETRR